ncbi:hypothetical protein C8R43DRAFT_900556 [Mycena crocata]|nr:hypothetical protein C8R43DRAFT_900556 [Mycena crocata]
MCIAAVLNGSTVQYTLTGTGQQTVGWMGMGFGSQMANTPMVIIWGNSDGSVTLSQRQAPAEQMPTLVPNPPVWRFYQRPSATSTTGNSSFVFTIPANSDTKQSLIWGFGTINPGSSEPSATLQQHLDSGVIQLDLSRALNDTSPSTPDDIPFTSRQRMIVAHAVLGVVGFAVLLPCGAFLARYLRTFTPTWYTGHWIVQFGLAGPMIIAGFVLGFQVAGKIGATMWDTHKRTGVILFALYWTQCVIGALIHFVKPKHVTRRPLQNYFHAVLGLAIIGLAMYQIRTGFREEWPTFSGRGSVSKGINTLWLVWCIVLPIIYAAGLLFLRKQYRQEEASQKRRVGAVGSSDVDTSTSNLRSERYRDHDD